MVTWVRNLFAAPVFENDEDKTRSAWLVNVFLWAMLGIVLLAAPVLILASQNIPATVMTAGTVIAFAAAVVGLIRLLHRGRVRQSSILLACLILVIFTAVLFVFGGIRNTASPGLILAIFVAGLLVGGRATFTLTLLSMLAAAGVYSAERFFGLTILPLAEETDYDDLFMVFALFSSTAVLVTLSQHRITEALQRTRRHERALAETNRELEKNRDILSSRTRDLEHQSRQLQAAAAVTRGCSTIGDTDELLKQMANLIQDHFDVHYTGVFLLTTDECAVLRAATGDIGQQMLNRGLQVRIGDQSLVGRAIGSGRHQIARDTDLDTRTLDPPPPLWKRSEIVLPLRVSRHIIGALDLQSQMEDAFDEKDAAILQTMADQLALTIEHVRLIGEMQQTVRELRAASMQHANDPWQAERPGASPQGYRYRHLQIEPISDQPPEARQAWSQGRPVVTTTPEGDDQATSTLAVPVKLRDRVIGVLNLSLQGDPPTPDTVALVEQVASRLALAFENTILLDETRQRAQRDRLIADITGKARASMDVEEILQTTVQELARALGTDRAFIRLSVSNRPSEE